jgi:preprotein translocase subunit SecE
MGNKRQSEMSSVSRFDGFKWILVFALIAAGIWANYCYRQFDWSLRFAGWIVLACIVLFIVLQTRVGRAFWQFAKDARMELRKVVWPTRQETTQTTMMVMVMVMIMAMILWGLDTLLFWIVGLLTG